METSRQSLASFIEESKQTLYLTHRCTHVSLLNNATIQIAADEENPEKRISLDKIRRLVIIGHIGHIDSDVLYRMMIKKISVDFMDIWGYPQGQLEASDKEENYFITVQQNFFHASKALEFAKQVIMAKIINGHELIRRKSDLNKNYWHVISSNIKYANNFKELLGAEGYASHVYFSLWGCLLKNYGFDWQGRQKHPALDPVNYMLSLGYTLLRNRLASALKSKGLNPRIGYFHIQRGTHCALASDLMEQFRPFVDTTVLKLIRKSIVKTNDFLYENGGCRCKCNDTFSVILHAFESMFANIYNIYWGCNSCWTRYRRSLNDLIEDCAQNYSLLLQRRDTICSWRLAPCKDF
ncbi:MAG: CRISPR-associated endonuclease Cas1 [Succinivibrio sp.]